MFIASTVTGLRLGKSFHVLLVALLCVNCTAKAAEVTLGRTRIVGREDTSNNVEFFGGIPYAQPPLGNRRLRPPVPTFSLDVDVLQARSFGSPCVQLPPDPFGIFPPNPIPASENCLSLDVYRPKGTTSRSKLPVMVYVYGGGFSGGSSAEYNGTNIVTQSVNRGTPVIYVSMNYRLGPLGFPVGAEAGQEKVLNLGLQDQLAALRWINRNIAVFGGDRDKVTAFGESAGSMSIHTLLLSSNLENLVHGVILQSGSGGTTPSFGPTRRQRTWDDFVEALPQCADTVASSRTLECLRHANFTTEELVKAFIISSSQAPVLFPWAPSLDGPQGVFPDLPSELYKRGRIPKIPFIAGTNLDEGTILAPPGVASEDVVRQWIVANYSSPSNEALVQDAAQKMLELYPANPAVGSPYNTGNETFGLSVQFKRLASIFGDLFFDSSRRLWSQVATKAHVKNYAYQLTGLPSAFFPPVLGIPHGYDVLYVFNLIKLLPGGTSPEHQAFSERIVDYWISFATSLDPNDGKGVSRPIWPRYRTENPTILELNGGNTKTIPDTYRKEQIGFINSVSLLFRH